MNRIETLEINPPTNGQLIYDKEGKSGHRRKILQYVVLEN